MNTHDHDYDYDHDHLKTVANICIPPVYNEGDYDYYHGHFKTNICIPPVYNEGCVRPPRCDLLSASGQAEDSKVLPVEHGQVVDQPSPHVHNHRLDPDDPHDHHHPGHQANRTEANADDRAQSPSSR